MAASGSSGQAVRGQDLDAVDHRHHDQQGQDDAGHVHPARVRVAGFRDQGRTEDQQRQDDRHGHQQDGAPPEVLHQPAAEDRAQGGAAGEAGGPDGHGQPAPVGLGEDVADQGQGGGHQHGAEESQPRASGNQPFGAGGEGRDRRDGGEAGAADEEQPAAADPVAEAAHRHEQAGEDQGIGVDNPEQLHAGGVEAARDRRQRKGQGGVVDGHEQHREHQQRQRQPVAPRRARCLGRMSSRRRVADRVGDNGAGAAGDGSVAHEHNCTVWTVQLRNRPLRTRPRHGA